MTKLEVSSTQVLPCFLVTSVQFQMFTDVAYKRISWLHTPGENNQALHSQVIMGFYKAPYEHLIPQLSLSAFAEPTVCSDDIYHLSQWNVRQLWQKTTFP